MDSGRERFSAENPCPGCGGYFSQQTSVPAIVAATEFQSGETIPPEALPPNDDPEVDVEKKEPTRENPLIGVPARNKIDECKSDVLTVPPVDLGARDDRQGHRPDDPEEKTGSDNPTLTDLVDSKGKKKSGDDSPPDE
jgi:hypothetical protein